MQMYLPSASQFFCGTSSGQRLALVSEAGSPACLVGYELGISFFLGGQFVFTGTQFVMHTVRGILDS